MKKVLFLIVTTAITSNTPLLGSNQMQKSKNNSPLQPTHIQESIDSEFLAEIARCEQENKLVVIDDTMRLMASKYVLNRAVIHNVNVSPYSPRNRKKR